MPRRPSPAHARRPKRGLSTVPGAGRSSLLDLLPRGHQLTVVGHGAVRRSAEIWWREVRWSRAGGDGADAGKRRRRPWRTPAGGGHQIRCDPPTPPPPGHGGATQCRSSFASLGSSRCLLVARGGGGSGAGGGGRGELHLHEVQRPGCGSVLRSCSPFLLTGGNHSSLLGPPSLRFTGGNLSSLL
jgi:hypothetical protein